MDETLRMAVAELRQVAHSASTAADPVHDFVMVLDRLIQTLPGMLGTLPELANLKSELVTSLTNRKQEVNTIKTIADGISKGLNDTATYEELTDQTNADNLKQAGRTN
jgi:hypothetical protein